MKKIILCVCIGIISGCAHSKSRQETTLNIDSLKSEVAQIKELYRPGLGEIMGGIQVHHAKLWFAAINDNWKLADYEIAEIKERIEQARDVETERPEMKTISMIFPAIDSIAASINHRDITSFKNSYQLLTNTCNNCHKSNNFEFNVIMIPTAPPVTNQDFKGN